MLRNDWSSWLCKYDGVMQWLATMSSNEAIPGFTNVWSDVSRPVRGGAPVEGQLPAFRANHQIFRGKGFGLPVVSKAGRSTGRLAETIFRGGPSLSAVLYRRATDLRNRDRPLSRTGEKGPIPSRNAQPVPRNGSRPVETAGTTVLGVVAEGFHDFPTHGWVGKAEWSP